MSEHLMKTKSNYFVQRKVDYVTYHTEEEVHSALLEVLVFAVFLVVTTTLAFNCQNIYKCYTNNSFQRLLIEKGLQQDFICEIETISSIENWWEFVEKYYLNNLNTILVHPNEKSTKKTDPLGLHNKPRLFSVHILLQPPRLRQIRVKPKKCKNPGFIKTNRACYGGYRSSDQSNEPYHKGTKYMDIDKSDIRTVWAITKFYSGGGYFVSIPSKETETILKSLRDKQWIDEGTRFVELSMETYNYNLGMFSSVKLITEVLPTGNIVVSFFTSSVPLESIWTVNHPGIIVTSCIFYVIATFYMWKEINEMRIFGFRNYFSIAWNYLDWSIVISAFTSLCFSITYPFYIEKYLNDIENENELASLDTVVFYHIFYEAAICLCTFQLWIRIFRFTTFNTAMLHFSIAIRRCGHEICALSFELVLTFTIFSLVGILGFGIKHPSFQTFFEAFIFMFRLIVLDFDYTDFSVIHEFWGPIYIVLYIFVAVLILKNMFLAIISQTYIHVKLGTEEQPFAIKAVFIDFMNKVKDFFKYLKNKLKKELKTAASSQKRIHFLEESVSKESNPDRISKGLSENDFVELSLMNSITSLVSPDTFKKYDEKVEEAKNERTRMLTSRLNERLNRLEAGYKHLGKDIDQLLAILEGKSRRSTV